MIKTKTETEDLIKEISKAETVIKSLKVEKLKIIEESILNHSLISSIDFQIWKKNEELLKLYQKLTEETLNGN